MTNSFQKIRCPRCGGLRSPDLNIPCELCHSRKIPIFGYTYGIERRWLLFVLVVLAIICFFAILIGALFVLYRIWNIEASVILGWVNQVDFLFRSL